MKLIFTARDDQFEQALKEVAKEIDDARAGAVHDAANLAIREGRANIAAAGFPSTWQRALAYDYFPNPGGDPAAVVFDRIPFAGVFESGATITGKPLLWLPIEQNLPPGIHSPQQYGKKLVSVNVKGKRPLLFDKNDRLRGPLFVGVSAIHIGKRFNLLPILAAAAAKVRDFYEQRIKG